MSARPPALFRKERERRTGHETKEGRAPGLAQDDGLEKKAAGEAPAPHNLSQSSLLSRHNLKQPHNRLNSSIKVRNVELFVGGVEVVVGEAEAHHEGGE